MSDFIFDFVHSLTAREKTYFKRYTQLHNKSESKNYLRIYTFLEKQKTYDEQAIKQHFKGEKFIKYLSSEKHYLLEQILNSLINFHSNTSTNRKLLKFILYINILSEKGFRKKAAKIINQAKKLAYKHEEFTIILQLIKMEEEILFSHGIINYKKQLETLKEERKETYDNIQLLNELRLLKEEARELQYVFSQGAKDPKDYPHVFFSPLFEDPRNVKSLKAQSLVFYTKSILYYLLNDFENSYLYDLAYLSFFEENEYLFSINEKLPVISNFMYLCAKTKREKEFKTGLKKLIALQGEKGIDGKYIFYIKYARILELYHKTKNLKETRSILPEIIEYTQKNTSTFGKTEVDHLIVLLVRASIETKEFSKSQQCLNMWYDAVSIDVSLGLIKVFAMITFYELGFTNLLEREINSAYNMLKKRKRLGAIEQAFISFFKKVLNANNSSAVKKLFKAFHLKLKTIKNNPSKNKLFEDFDFIDWCDNKMASYKN